jgi:hypothetical protein
MKSILLVFVFCGLFMEGSSQGIHADPLTGRAVTGLPIWTINAADLAAPIGLSYSSGAKVNDGEGTAGMGWSLGAGGEVRREVRGLPDDYKGAYAGIAGDWRRGWLFDGNAMDANNLSTVGNLNCGTTEFADFTTMASLDAPSGGYRDDTEPDIFYFHAPGLSGQFVFNKNRLIRTIPYMDVKIDVTRTSTDSLIHEVVITNNKGVKYYFSDGEFVTRTSRGKSGGPGYFARSNQYFPESLPASFYTAWRLTSMISPNGAAITFLYGNISDATNVSHVKYINPSPSSHVDTLYSVTDKFQSKQLVQIIGLNEKATLAWNGGVIGSVIISELTYQSSVKKFNMRYHMITASKRSKKKPVRMYLSGFQQEANCSVFPGYEFSYYGVDFAADTTSLPYDTFLGQDLFGYYNSTAISGVPDIYQKASDSGTDGDRFRIAPASGYSLLFSGGGRSVDTSKLYYGSMKSMTLPSGGMSTVKYEASQYYDAITATNQVAGAPRVKRITTTGSYRTSDLVVSYRYRSSTTPTRSSGLWTYKPMFVATSIGLIAAAVPENIAPEEMIYYSRVEESVMGRGRTVYEFQNAAMSGSAATGDFVPSLSLIARPNPGSGNPCQSLTGAKGGYYSFPHAPNTNYDFERGLPLRVSEYTAAGKLVRRKINTYSRTSTTIDPVYGVRFETGSAGSFQYQKYSILTRVDKMIATETTRVYVPGTDSVSSAYVETSSSYTYNSMQMLKRIKTVNSDNTTDSTVFKYAGDYAVSGTGTNTQARMIKTLQSNNMQSVPIETVSYNQSSVTGAAITMFGNTFGSSRVLPAKQLTHIDPDNFVAAHMTGTAFIYDSTRYLADTYLDVYDAYGTPLVLRDQSRMTASVLLGYNGAIPAVDIKNARYDQIVYSDFEPHSSTTVTQNGTISTTDPWTGQNCLALGSSTYAQQTSVVRGAGKNYRFSCWAKGAATLSIQINSATAVVVGTSGATWQYIEKVIDMSAIIVGATFSFKLTSTASVSVDNIAFYPESSTISSHAYDPLNGKTADLDSRGGAGFQDYDQLGRVRYVKNQDKDIVQIQDYHYKSANAIVRPTSHFTGGTSPDMGVTSIYTADASCMGGITYAWTVDGVPAGTSSSIGYAFDAYKNYRVKLVASSPLGSSTTEILVCPKPVISVAVSKPTGESASFNCTNSGDIRHLTATIAGCYDHASGGVTYKWSKATTLGGIRTQLGTTTTQYFDWHLENGTNNYVFCEVITRCPNQSTGANYPYSGQTIESYIVFTWSSGGGC